MPCNKPARCTSLLYMDEIKDPASNFDQWTSNKKALNIAGATEMQTKFFELFISTQMYNSMHVHKKNAIVTNDDNNVAHYK